MKGYTHTYEIREHRAGGGGSLLINFDIRYEIRSDIKFNVDDVKVCHDIYIGYTWLRHFK